MAIIKCKMCGGDLNLPEGQTVAECEYCGSRQTVPVADNEKKITLFARANRLRAACEFDKAAGIYESIVADFPEEAEAYWGLVLCRYGIEYVDDPTTGKKIPTCHRSSFDSIFEDSDFEQVQENADAVARKLYREEAKQIEELRKGIVAVSNKESPYDIFICYKETDEKGERTLDSVLSQDIYDALTAKNYRVFFSRISLEDKLGQEYEPYIFAALNSAKIMLVVGTDYDYYTAVWVKNEWSRYLKLMTQDKDKHLIPCFKGIDAYDMPKEFAKLQAQDLGKVGAMQDLLRGIDKLLAASAPAAPAPDPAAYNIAAKLTSLLDRGYMALEDGDWSKADSFFEEVLNNDSKNAPAYFGKTLVLERCHSPRAFWDKRLQMHRQASIQEMKLPADTEHIDRMAETCSIPMFVDPGAIRNLYGYDLTYVSCVASRKTQYDNEEHYFKTHRMMARAEEFATGEFAQMLQQEKAALFTALNQLTLRSQEAEAAAIQALKQRYAAHLANADEKAKTMYENGLQRRDSIYMYHVNLIQQKQNIFKLQQTAAALDTLGDYRDSKKMAAHCRQVIADLQKAQQEEAARRAIARQKAQEEHRRKVKKTLISLAILLMVIIILLVLLFKLIIPSFRYSHAQDLLEAGQYEEAKPILTELEDFRDCPELIFLINRIPGFEKGQYDREIRTILAHGTTLTIHFNTDGGQAMDSAVYTTASDYTGLWKADKEGYRFLDWEFSSLQIISGSEATLELKACYTDQFFLYYDLAGGTVSGNPTQYHKDGRPITLKNPTRPGYTFAGWTGPDLTAPVENLTIPTGSYGNRTYTANWKPNTYIFTLDPNGGTVECDSISAEYEQHYTLPAPVRPYYTFTGWYSRNQKYTDGTWRYASDVKLTAQWELTQYVINYHLDGGTNSASNPKTYTYTTPQTTLQNPSKDGFKFLGWYTDSSFTTRVTEIKKGSSGTLDLYAKWEIITYTVTYVLNGGTNSSQNPSSFTVINPDIILAEPTRTGYTFAGWYQDSSFKYKITRITNGSHSNITLYAKWIPVGFTITYHLDGGTNSSQNPGSYHIDSQITLKDPTRAGYRFRGWYSDSSFTKKVTQIAKGSQGNITLYAKWEKATYSITYHVNGGTNSSQNVTTYTIDSATITLKDPTRTGYIFKGWYKDSNYTNKVTQISKGSYGDLNLYAKWEAIKYTITYNLGGGTNSSQNPSSYTIDSQITLKDPTRTGYKFLGWYSDSSYSTKVTQIAKGSQKNYTLYAKWEIITYTITYVTNGGTISGTQVTTFTVNDLPINLPTASKSGMAFLYWGKDKATGSPISQITTVGNVTVAACFMDPNLKLALSSDKTYYKVTGYSGTATHLEIPAYYEGLPVKEIGSSAFYSSYSNECTLVSVTMPDTVTKIGSAAFKDCEYLTTVVFSNSLVSIGDDAFMYCSSLTSITLPDSLQTIGEWAFYSCKGLTSITFPSSLKTIDDIAFAHCTSLTSIVIPNSVTYLGGQCFSGCTNLKTVKLGTGLTSIEYNSFDDCTSLTSINIPDTITEINSNAFRNCKSLTKIIIPASVKTMESAFSNCTSLTIYCRASTIPSGWSNNWNGGRPVVWGYTGD